MRQVFIKGPYVPGPMLLTVTGNDHVVSAGPASQVRDSHSHRARRSGGPKLGLMLCRRCLEMPHHFLTKACIF